jgi:phosphopantetheinyl transferase
VISLRSSSDSPKTRCERFMEKIFTINEQRYIKNQPEAVREQTIWLLWSMKESTYKSYYKQFRQRTFAPKMFDCFVNQNVDDMDCVAGTVKTLFQDFCTQSYILEDCIHTVAYVNERQVIHDFCFPLDSEEYEVQASTVRFRLCEELARLEGCDNMEIEIRKDARGIPHVYIGNKAAAFDVSMSHHGTFGAYAISHELY